ncbi:uncharacterized protein LOC124274578 [Haliotis rubra]|uniref:uncharacterized protein LOC124274578 n=1 Tax=Haliotis rubra TaxID=36100 RepID=UPI001EE4ED17|nr:uncharacterized protein LOC124274578 [Haliotis rubra]
MALVICVAVVLFSSVSGHDWLTRRDTYEEPGFDCFETPCELIYEPVFRIMARPTFSNLIEDGRLTLSCSRETLTLANECKHPSSGCMPYVEMEDLFIAFDTFCRHKTEILDDEACWTHGLMPLAVVSCHDANSIAFANCVQARVTNITECSSGRTGAILRQLVLDVRA